MTSSVSPPDDDLTSAAQRQGQALRDRRTDDLLRLFERRPDLRGINAWADEVVDQISWSA